MGRARPEFLWVPPFSALPLAGPWHSGVDVVFTVQGHRPVDLHSLPATGRPLLTPFPPCPSHLSVDLVAPAHEHAWGVTLHIWTPRFALTSHIRWRKFPTPENGSRHLLEAWALRVDQPCSWTGDPGRYSPGDCKAQRRQALLRR